MLLIGREGERRKGKENGGEGRGIGGVGGGGEDGGEDRGEEMGEEELELVPVGDLAMLNGVRDIEDAYGGW